MKKKEFYSVIKIMSEYYGTKLSLALSEIYWQVFQNWSFEDFKHACNIIMQTRNYPSFPKISEITEALHGKPEDQAAIAYQTLIEAIKRIGPWDSVIFEDGAIGMAVEALGGWEYINQWSWTDWIYRKKDFEELYLANLRSGNTKPKKLYGAFERINGEIGQEGFNKPILITKDMKFITEEEEKKQIEDKGDKKDDYNRKI